MSIPENIKELTELCKKLIEKSEALEYRIIELQKDNAELKRENAELKARLNLDSHNSSKPPSSDGLKKKPAFPKEKSHKQGGQKNHKGKTLEMVENPDITIICKAEICNCGCNLNNEPFNIIGRRQVFELPKPRLEITEFQVVQNICPQCGKVHRGQFPENVKAKTQYGEQMKAYCVYLNNGIKIPFEKIQTLISDLYGYPINEGTIILNNRICYDKLEPVETIIQNKLIKSSTIHNDESGIRCQGKLHWLHVASNALYTYLFIHKKRGKEAIESEESILMQFYGWSVHDCWASYFNLTHLKHAICGAHLLRELQALIESESQWAIEFKKFLLDIFYTPIESRIERRSEIELKFDQIIILANNEEPIPIKTGGKGKLKRTKGRNLFERLQKFKSAVLAFAFNPEVPFTNNQAERDIRPIKVKQKISGCFRTITGAQHYARIAGFISTVRKHKLNVFTELCNVFYNKPVLSSYAY